MRPGLTDPVAVRFAIPRVMALTEQTLASRVCGFVETVWSLCGGEGAAVASSGSGGGLAEHNLENGAARIGRRVADLAAMRLDNGAHHGEAEPISAFL
jgi:hypothetical protein